jgi:hypothetical protein
MNGGHLVERLFAAKYLLQHLGSYCTRTDRIDSNTISSVYDGGGLRQSKDSVHAGHVMAGGWNRQKPADRGSIDN